MGNVINPTRPFTHTVASVRSNALILLLVICALLLQLYGFCCLVFEFWCSSLCSFFFVNHLAGEEQAACYCADHTIVYVCVFAKFV